MNDPKPLEYGQPEKRSGMNVPTPVALAIIAVATVLLWVLVGPDSHPHAREKANQIKCASNLRQIGQAIQLYAQDNQGLFPPDARTIAATQNVSLECFVCPSSPDMPAKNQDELYAHHSYIYVSADLTTQSKPDCIVVVEDPANHNLEGSNVLFADGHVEFLNLPTVQLFLNELNAGHNPPTILTPTLSKAGAEQDYEKNWRPRIPQLKAGVWRIPTTQAAGK